MNFLAIQCLEQYVTHNAGMDPSSNSQMTLKLRIRDQKSALTLAFLLALTPIAKADSWSYPATRAEKIFTFGKTKIVMVTDGTADRRNPEFTMQVFKDGELQAQVRNLSFETVAASPDGHLFVGLSNRGIPGSAVVVFTDRGAVTMLASHRIAQFDYCDKSVSIVRKWYNEDDPQIRFGDENTKAGTSGITLRDCRGQTVDLSDAVLKAYATAERKPR
ncbi:hypothetical protein [Massilia sp. CF038]|uniref:hypothetical protein n=1 Tax=Massilia sp. CF038 TaxID=1881045 RepID=UPI00090F07C7|nr:hypothetical protein [Massilia sp. CF038]SHH12260.1 hypothetical protein SAMN05428948_2889 [Massilia sp. CF038]